MKRVLFFVVVLMSAVAAHAADRQWIFLRDKGPGTAGAALSPELRDAALRTLTPRAIKRRAKVLPVDALVDAQDLPVYAPYLDSLAGLGIHPTSVSRWNNAVTAPLTDAQITAVRGLHFIDTVRPVRRYVLSDRDIETVRSDMNVLAKTASVSTDVLDYGGSFAQIRTSHINALHALGITGNGVLLGMLDTGFRWREHDGTSTAHVLGEYDFVMKDSVTANDSIDDPSQDSHGTGTFSMICSWLPGTMLGGAFNASFLLAKTEDIRSETHAEEDNYANALEWMESQGVDVTSSSLGYSIFDSGQVSYTIAEMNGRTTIVAKAAARAARLGVCVVTAAGNSGGNASWPYIASPGDADSIITAGAVDSNGILARFSSRGPTADGRIKPDVCAMGVAVLGAQAGIPDGFGRGNGTSFATPMTSSCAALLLSAFPDLTPIQVRNALRASADHAAKPDTAYGWGVFDVYNAALATGVVISNPPRMTVDAATGAPMIVAAVAAAEGIDDSTVFVRYSRNHEKSLRFAQMQRRCYTDYFVCTLPNLQPGDSIIYTVYAQSVTGRSGTWTSPYISLDSTPFRTSPLDWQKACAQVPGAITMLQNYPNPFYARTTFRIGTPSPQHATLELFNLLGQHAATVFDGELVGFRDVDLRAPLLPSGVYFAWLRVGKSSSNIMVRKAP